MSDRKNLAICKWKKMILSHRCDIFSHAFRKIGNFVQFIQMSRPAPHGPPYQSARSCSFGRQITDCVIWSCMGAHIGQTALLCQTWTISGYMYGTPLPTTGCVMTLQSSEADGYVWVYDFLLIINLPYWFPPSHIMCLICACFHLTLISCGVHFISLHYLNTSHT